MTELPPDPGWLWYTGAPAELTRFVVHHLFVGHPLLHGSHALRDDPRALAKRLYETVHEQKIPYAQDPPFTAEHHHQPIRQPHDMLVAHSAGNCLDLSLMFAGLCAAANLRPLLALMRPGPGIRHVLVLVSLTPPGTADDLAWGALPIENGRARPDRDIVAEVLQAGEFVAVEVTSATTRPEHPDGRRFDRACADGADVLAKATNIEIIDPVFLQKLGWKPDFTARSLWGPTPGNPAFGSEVSKEFRERLGADPAVWDLWHISRIQTEPGTPQHDTRLALEQALLALGAFEAVGGREPRMRQLKSIYFHALQRDSEARTAEIMLVYAATARHDDLPGLVALLLEIARLRGAERTEQQEQVFRTWLKAQAQDAQEGDIDEHAGRTYQAVIDLGAENQTLSVDWERTLSITVDPPISATDELRADCTTEDEFKEALFGLLEKLFDALPVDRRRLEIDLVAPRYLLDRRVEHMDVVPAAPLRLKLSPQYRPRFRWALHHHVPQWRDLQADRQQYADWDAAPGLVPDETARDDADLDSWLEDEPALTPPCLVAGKAEGTCDQLTAMLLKGQGFILWYPDGTHGAKHQAVVDEWAMVEGSREFKIATIPDRLFTRFRRATPAIIWNDLDSRGSSRLRTGRLQVPARGSSEGNPE